MLSFLIRQPINFYFVCAYQLKLKLFLIVGSRASCQSLQQPPRQVNKSVERCGAERYERRVRELQTPRNGRASVRVSPLIGRVQRSSQQNIRGRTICGFNSEKLLVNFDHEVQTGIILWLTDEPRHPSSGIVLRSL